MSAPDSRELAQTNPGHEVKLQDNYDRVKDYFEHGLSLYYKGADPEVLTNNARIQSAVLPLIDHYKGTRNQHVEFCLSAAIQAAHSSPHFRSTAPDDIVTTVQADMARTDRRRRVIEVVEQTTNTILKDNQDATAGQKRALSAVANPKFIAAEWERTALIDEVTSALESQACSLAVRDIKQQPSKLIAIPRLLALAEKIPTKSDNQTRRQTNELLRLYAESVNPRTVIADHNLDQHNINQLGKHLNQPARGKDIENRARLLEALETVPPRSEDAAKITAILQDIVYKRVIDQAPQPAAAQSSPAAVVDKAIQKASEVPVEKPVRQGSVTDTRAMVPSLAIQVPMEGRGKGRLLVSGSSAAAVLGLMGSMVGPAVANATPANQYLDLQVPTTTNLHLSNVATTPSRITRPASSAVTPVKSEVVPSQTDVIDLSISPADQTSIEPAQPATVTQAAVTSEITTVTPPIAAPRSVSEVTPQLSQVTPVPQTSPSPLPSQVTQLGIPSQPNHVETTPAYQPVSLQIGGYTAPAPVTPVQPANNPYLNAARAHMDSMEGIRPEAAAAPTPLAVHSLDISVSPDAPRTDYAPVVAPTLTTQEATDTLNTAVKSNQTIDVLQADYDNLLLAQGKIATVEPADLPLTQAAVKAAISDAITRLQSQKGMLSADQYATGIKAALLANAIALHPGIATSPDDVSHLVDTQHPNFTQTIVSGVNANPDMTATPFSLAGTEVGSNSSYAYTAAMLNQLVGSALSNSYTDEQRTALQLDLDPSSQPDVTTVPQTLSGTGTDAPVKPSPNVKTNNPPAQPHAPAPKHSTAPKPKAPEAKPTSIEQQYMAAADAMIAKGGETGRQGFVMKICLQNGFTPTESSGIVGDLTQESNVNSSSTSRNGRTIGMAQWEGGRDDALRRFAAARNKPWDDPETQVLFIIDEMHRQYPGGHLNELRQIVPNATGNTSAYEALKSFSTNTPAKAAMVFEYTFERASDPRMNNRVRYAEEAFDEFNSHLNKTVTAPKSHESHESSSQKLAQEILPYWGKTIDGNPQPLLDFQTVAAGKEISNWSDTHNVPTSIDPRVLEVYLQFAQEGKWKIYIGNIVRGHGYNTKQHPHGRASDIIQVTNLHTGETTTFQQGTNKYKQSVVRDFRHDLSEKLPAGSWMGQDEFGGDLKNGVNTGWDKPNHQHFQVPH